MNVDVLMPPVAMGDDKRLVVLEVQIPERAVDDAAQSLLVEPLLGREAECQVIDGLPDRVAGVHRGRAHEAGDQLGILDGEVADGDPGDSLRPTSCLGAQEVGLQAGEAPTVHDLADHMRLRVARSSSPRVSARRRESSIWPVVLATRASWLTLLPSRASW